MTVKTLRDLKPGDTVFNAVATASCHAACNGCRHQHSNSDGGWCYMFREKPEILPCMQHDKFEGQRNAVGKFVLKFPVVLSLLVSGVRP